MTMVVEKPQCPKCASFRVRARLRTGDMVCERCAFVWKPREGGRP